MKTECPEQFKHPEHIYLLKFPVSAAIEKDNCIFYAKVSVCAKNREDASEIVSALRRHGGRLAESTYIEERKPRPTFFQKLLKKCLKIRNSKDFKEVTYITIG